MFFICKSPSICCNCIFLISNNGLECSGMRSFPFNLHLNVDFWSFYLFQLAIKTSFKDQNVLLFATSGIFWEKRKSFGQNFLTFSMISVALLDHHEGFALNFTDGNCQTDTFWHPKKGWIPCRKDLFETEQSFGSIHFIMSFQ